MSSQNPTYRPALGQSGLLFAQQVRTTALKWPFAQEHRRRTLFHTKQRHYPAEIVSFVAFSKHLFLQVMPEKMNFVDPCGVLCNDNRLRIADFRANCSERRLFRPPRRMLPPDATSELGSKRSLHSEPVAII